MATKHTSARALMRGVALSFALALAFAWAMMPAPAFAADTVQIPLTVEKTISGDTPEASAEFSFALEAETADAPMPESTSVSITGEGTGSFGSIPFTEEGRYQYAVYEQAGDVKGYTYDDTVYHVLVDVSLDAQGQVVTQVVAWEGDDSSSKVSELKFENVYEATADSDGSDGDDNSGSDNSGTSDNSSSNNSNSNKSGSNSSASNNSSNSSKSGTTSSGTTNSSKSSSGSSVAKTGDMIADAAPFVVAGIVALCAFGCVALRRRRS